MEGNKCCNHKHNSCTHDRCCSDDKYCSDDKCCSDEFEKNGYVLENDDEDDKIVFPKATVDPRLIQLQKDVTEFVTSVILKHEKEFYQLVSQKLDGKYEYYLGRTCSHIILMIKETTKKFYNKLYYDIQHKTDTDLTKLVLEICQFADYGAHVLLDKLFRLTWEIHLEVSREDLVFKKNDYELYEKSVLMQINKYLISLNLLHVLSKGDDEDGEFVNLPEGQYAFDIDIEKNIRN